MKVKLLPTSWGYKFLRNVCGHTLVIEKFSFELQHLINRSVDTENSMVSLSCCFFSPPTDIKLIPGLPISEAFIQAKRRVAGFTFDL